MSSKKISTLTKLAKFIKKFNLLNTHIFNNEITFKSVCLGISRSEMKEAAICDIYMFMF